MPGNKQVVSKSKVAKRDQSPERVNADVLVHFEGETTDETRCVVLRPGDYSQDELVMLRNWTNAGCIIGRYVDMEINFDVSEESDPVWRGQPHTLEEANKHTALYERLLGAEELPRVFESKNTLSFRISICE